MVRIGEQHHLLDMNRSERMVQIAGCKVNEFPSVTLTDVMVIDTSQRRGGAYPGLVPGNQGPQQQRKDVSKGIESGDRRVKSTRQERDGKHWLQPD